MDRPDDADHLIGLNAELQDRIFVLHHGMTVGRNIHSGLFLPDPNLLQEHWKIDQLDCNSWLLQNLDRSNQHQPPTRSSQSLEHNQVISLGRFQFKVVLSSSNKLFDYPSIVPISCINNINKYTRTTSASYILHLFTDGSDRTNLQPTLEQLFHQDLNSSKQNEQIKIQAFETNTYDQENGLQHFTIHIAKLTSLSKALLFAGDVAEQIFKSERLSNFCQWYFAISNSSEPIDLGLLRPKLCNYDILFGTPTSIVNDSSIYSSKANIEQNATENISQWHRWNVIRGKLQGRRWKARLAVPIRFTINNDPQIYVQGMIRKAIYDPVVSGICIEVVHNESMNCSKIVQSTTLYETIHWNSRVHEKHGPDYYRSRWIAKMNPSHFCRHIDDHRRPSSTVSIDTTDPNRSIFRDNSKRIA